MPYMYLFIQLLNITSQEESISYTLTFCLLGMRNIPKAESIELKEHEVEKNPFLQGT